MAKPSSEPSELMRFLTEEVRDRYYADQLLERADAAGQGKPAPGASGDAYYVAFGPDEVVIEYRYDQNRLPVRIPREDFIAAVQSRREQLK